MTGNIGCRLTRTRLRPAILAMAVTFGWAIRAAGQDSGASVGSGQATALAGSVPSGPASDQVIQLTLRDAINSALRYNLGAIESGQNAQIARGQRRLALSNLLPQVSAGASEIDQDVRAALLNLNAAKEQVEVAKQNVELANEGLARSKDRFTSGGTDNVEVVQAEQALASANDQYITSLYDHNFAKLSLARALGVARTNYGQYLGGNVVPDVRVR